LIKKLVLFYCMGHSFGAD